MCEIVSPAPGHPSTSRALLPNSAARIAFLLGQKVDESDVPWPIEPMAQYLLPRTLSAKWVGADARTPSYRRGQHANSRRIRASVRDAIAAGHAAFAVHASVARRFGRTRAAQRFSRYADGRVLRCLRQSLRANRRAGRHHLDSQ